MPIKKGNANIGAIYKGTTQIAKIYKGTKLLFENAKWLDYLFEHIYHSLIPTTISGKTVQDKAKLTKISGNGVVENQLVNLDTTVPSGTTGKLSSNRSDITTDLTNHKITVTSTGDTVNYFGLGVTYLSRLQGHKVLCLAKVVNVSLASSTYATISFGWCLENFTANHPATPSDPNIYHIGTFRSNISTNYLNIESVSPTPTSGDYIEISNPQMIDLTLMFGTGNEPTTITDNRIQALLNRGYIAYNTGSYKNSRVGEIETFNTNNQLLDTITLPGLLELNGAINSHDTFEITNTDYVFTRNVGVVNNFSNVAKSDYYSNLNGISCYEFGPKPYSGWWDTAFYKCLCNKCVIKNYSGVSEKNYIAQNTSNAGFLYIPSSELTLEEATTVIQTLEIIYPLATPQVITIPKKHLGCIDLGTLSWDVDTQGGKTIFKAYLSGGLGSQTSDGIANIYCSKYVSSSLNGLVSNDKQIRAFYVSSSNPCQLGVYDSAYSTAADFKSAMAGVYLFYETNAEVSDFDNIAQINAGGSITSNWFSWVRNQLVINGDFSDGTNSWTFESLTTTTNNNILSGTTTGINFRINQSISVFANHKYLLSYNFKLKSIAGSNSGRALYFADSADYFPGSQTLIKTIGDTLTDYKISAFATPTISGTTMVRLVRGMGFVIGDTFDTSEIEFIDLTLAFGAGNEPTSVNDPRIQYIINNGYIPYDTGADEGVNSEVLPNVSFKIKCK